MASCHIFFPFLNFHACLGFVPQANHLPKSAALPCGWLHRLDIISLRPRQYVSVEGAEPLHIGVVDPFSLISSAFFTFKHVISFCPGLFLHYATAECRAHCRGATMVPSYQSFDCSQQSKHRRYCCTLRCSLLFFKSHRRQERLLLASSCCEGSTIGKHNFVFWLHHRSSHSQNSLMNIY